MNSNSKVVTIYVQHQKRGGEKYHVTGLGEIVNKYSGAEVEQHTVRNN
jgi:hypothetical protein